MGRRDAPLRKGPGLVLDAGALLAFDRGSHRIAALLRRAVEEGRSVRLPSGVLGQVWRDGKAQFGLALMLRSHQVEIVPLDDRLARSCGVVCGLTRTSDVIDASVGGAAFRLPVDFQSAAGAPFDTPLRP